MNEWGKKVRKGISGGRRKRRGGRKWEIITFFLNSITFFFLNLFFFFFTIVPQIMTWTKIFTSIELNFHMNGKEVAYFMFWSNATGDGKSCHYEHLKIFTPTELICTHALYGLRRVHYLQVCTFLTHYSPWLSLFSIQPPRYTSLHPSWVITWLKCGIWIEMN